MRDFINQMTVTFKLFCNHIFLCENINFLPYTRRCYGRHHIMVLNMYTTSGLSILIHGVISFSEAMSCYIYAFSAIHIKCHLLW